MLRRLFYIFLIMMNILIYFSSADACTIPGWDTFEISVEVAANPIDMVALTSDLDFGGVWEGSDAFSNQPDGHPRCTVENRGYATVDYTVAATCSTGWIFGTTLGDIGTNRLVLAGVFTSPSGRVLSSINFSNNDVIQTVPGIASQTTFGIDAGCGGLSGDDNDSVKGFNVVPYASQIRHLRFMVQAPTSDTTGVEQVFTIIIGAVAQ